MSFYVECSMHFLFKKDVLYKTTDKKYLFRYCELSLANFIPPLDINKSTNIVLFFVFCFFVSSKSVNSQIGENNLQEAPK